MFSSIEGGVADRRFVEACPWFGVQVGEELLLGGQHFEMYRFSGQWYCLELHRRCPNFSQDDGFEKNVNELMQDLSTTVAKFMNSRPQGSGD